MNGKAIAARGYKDICTVYEFVQETAESTHITNTEETAKYENIPCRLSFNSSPKTVKANLANMAEQQVKLFLDPELQIVAGSKITVCHEGRTDTYKSAGMPKVYPGHQEIELEWCEVWA